MFTLHINIINTFFKVEQKIEQINNKQTNQKINKQINKTKTNNLSGITEDTPHISSKHYFYDMFERLQLNIMTSTVARGFSIFSSRFPQSSKNTTFTQFN